MIEPGPGSREAPDRPVGDILGRVVRIRLGGQEYRLPVRSIRANREWKAELDVLTSAKVDAVTHAGGSGFERLEQILTILEADDIVKMIDLLVSYDTSGILPTREVIEGIEPDASLDVIAACQEVWRAASPLVDTTLAAIETTMSRSETAGSERTSTPRRNGAGRRKRSKPN